MYEECYAKPMLVYNEYHQSKQIECCQGYPLISRLGEKKNKNKKTDTIR